jgi:hypothetical protein
VTLPTELKDVAGRQATRSELAAPIVSEAGVIGCLNVESDRLEAFSPADAEDDFTLVVVKRLCYVPGAKTRVRRRLRWPRGREG